MLSSCHHPPHPDTPTHSQHTSGRTVYTSSVTPASRATPTCTRTLTPGTGVAKTGQSQALSSLWTGGVEREAGDSVPRPKREGWERTCVSLSFHKLLTDGNFIKRSGGEGGRQAEEATVEAQQPGWGPEPAHPAASNQEAGVGGGGKSTPSQPEGALPQALRGRVESSLRKSGGDVKQ